ncbi:MAG: T9SS type A sorting domain-containing protein [Flavobacteriales bacterium]|nr:T9SS type A sorting domain-containing protein [Flavobacteriales bacterium]MCB9447260.1 T9SS type A sorting domain-containing protein [Flavobacteriales bacterium]
MKHLKTLTCLLFMAVTHAFAFDISLISNPSAKNVCPGSTVTYLSEVTADGLGEWVKQIKWTCSANGVFTSTGTNTITYTYETPYSTPSISEKNQAVTWTTTNGATGWVQVEYTWGYLNFPFTGTKTRTIDDIKIGFQTTPGIIYTPQSLCTNNSGSYPVSTPAGVPTDYPYNVTYAWSATNAYMGASNGTSNSIQCSPSWNGNVNVTVRYQIPQCSLYSAPTTVSIPRTSSPPTAQPNYTSTNLNGGCIVRFVMQNPANGYGFEMSYNNSSWTATNGVFDVQNGTTLHVYVRSVNDCGAGPSRYCILNAPYKSGCAQKTVETDPNAVITIDAAQFEVKANPNPANQNVTVTINTPEQVNCTIQLFDMIGKAMITKEQVVDAGSNSLTLDVASVPAGVYFLSVYDGVNIQKEKLVISH